MRGITVTTAAALLAIVMVWILADVAASPPPATTRRPSVDVHEMERSSRGLPVQPPVNMH